MEYVSSKVNPVRGMRDFGPLVKKGRESALSSIRHTVRRFGFEEIETPAVESLERLESGEGGDNEAMLFKIVRRGLSPEEDIRVSDVSDLALRYDLTLPLTRFIASNSDLVSPVFRSFQTGPVWRAERPQRGRYRQFTQCDIDVVGDPGWTAEVEVISAGWQCLRVLGLSERCTVLLNDRRLLTALAEAVGVERQQQGLVFIALDKLQKIGRTAVIDELVEKASMDLASAERLLDAINDLEEAEINGESAFSPALEAHIPLFEIGMIASALRDLHSDVVIKFDPSLVRGMGYYTGSIFEVVHADAGSSICGGGRYDNFVGKWLGRQIPAVGFSIGFERMLEILDASETKIEPHLRVFYSSPESKLRALAFLQKETEENQYDVVTLDVSPSRIRSQHLRSLKSQGVTHYVIVDDQSESLGEVKEVSFGGN